MKPERDPEMATISAPLPSSEEGRAFLTRYALFAALEPVVSWDPSARWSEGGRELYYTDGAWGDSYLEDANGTWELTAWDWEPGDHPDPVDPAAPWSHSIARYGTGPFVSDLALVTALGEAASPLEDLGEAVDTAALARIAVNAAVDPALPEEVLISTLHAWASRLRLAPLDGEVAATAVSRIRTIWTDLVPGPRTLTPGTEGCIIARRDRRPDQEREGENLRLVVGWAVAAMAEAASGVPVHHRRLGFDATGIWSRPEPHSWAHLIGLAPDRLAVIGGNAKDASQHRTDLSGTALRDPDPQRLRAHRPDWVPRLLLSQLGTRMQRAAAWTIAGFWRSADNHTDSLLRVRGISRAMEGIVPDRSPDLAAAFGAVPPPAHEGARQEVLAMMGGLSAFLAGQGVLAPLHAGRPRTEYPGGRPSQAAAVDAPVWALAPYVDEEAELRDRTAASALRERIRTVGAVHAAAHVCGFTGPLPPAIDVDLRRPGISAYAGLGADVVIGTRADHTEWQVAAALRAAGPELAGNPELMERLQARLPIEFRDLDRVHVSPRYRDAPRVILGRLATAVGRPADERRLEEAVAILKGAAERAEALRVITPSWTTW